MKNRPKDSPHILPNHLVVQLTSLLVAIFGVYILTDTLLDRIVRHHTRIVSGSLAVDLPLLIGVSVIYLSTLLMRRKRSAWLVTILAFSLYLVIGVVQTLNNLNISNHMWANDVRSVVLPMLIIILLLRMRDEFVVKSDVQGFRSSVKFVVIILVITLFYGTTGFVLLDDSDFHQEIGLVSAVHYTVDQFNITTNKPVVAHTKRAQLFLDSLSFVSTTSVIYAAFSFFQPFKSRFSDQSHNRKKLEEILNKYGAQSEEFFKLWPHDKQYFFDSSEETGLAFHVFHGVALCVSDPVGNKRKYKKLLTDFNDLCFNNDWLPAFVHVGSRNLKLYKAQGYSAQLLGQEAVVDIEHFESEVKSGKYFRQILNRFNKQGYSYELLQAPHHKAVLDRLKTISDDWLSKGSRSERGFAMGYYTEEYIQMCDVAVARDAAGTIQAFANVVPAEKYDPKEATYDMLRQSSSALSNITDYILIKLMEDIRTKGYMRLNLGLSPLAGINEIEPEKKTILDNVLKFAYANGDTFYSFSGLYKFKSKYEPDWQDKYLIYKGGIRGFSRTLTALTRCMSKVVKH
jgi:phosphatidylglycerol lysyltransferase